MQTFVPHPDVRACAVVLDNRRLGKQRLEGRQILTVNVAVLAGEDPAELMWGNRPAVEMWRGHELRLISYTRAVCAEWVARGFKDTQAIQLLETELTLRRQFGSTLSDSWPPWWGNDTIHASHRSALLFKGWLDETLSWIDGPVDHWLKANGFPEHLDIKDVRMLTAVQDALGYHPPLCNTHYGCFGWPEAAALSYQWPGRAKRGGA